MTVFSSTLFGVSTVHQIHPDASLIPLAKRIANGDLHYHLFSNSLTPDETTVLGDFTEYASGTGYSVQTVASADFTSEGVAAHIGTLMASPIAWTITPDGSNPDCYGYYVTDTSNTYLLACGRFDDSPIVLTGGGVVSVTPVIADQSRFTS